MVGEVVNPGHLARELPGGRVVVVPQVRHDVVEPQHLVPLVRVFQTHVKRDLCPADGGARQLSAGVAARRAHHPRIPSLPRVPSVPRRTSRTRWPRLTWRAPRPGFPRPARLAFSPLNKARGRDGAQVLHDLQSRGARFGVVRVADHPTGAHHLVVRLGLGSLDQQRDRDDESQDHDDANHRGDGSLPLQSPRREREEVRFALGRNGGRW